MSWAGPTDAGLPDADDHVPALMAGRTRCEACGEAWPCRTAALQPADPGVMGRAIAEMIDVGWGVWQRAPEASDYEVSGGVVVGWTDDDEGRRTFRVLGFKQGRPITRAMAAWNVNVEASSLPNSASLRQAARQVARHVGARKGMAESAEVDLLSTALTLMRCATGAWKPGEGWV